MNLKQILLILKARYKIAVLAFVIVLAGGITYTLLQSKLYTASSTLVFDVKSPDPVAGTLLPVIPGYMSTQVDVIKSDRVTQAVVKLLKMDQNPTIRDQWKAATKEKGAAEAWMGDLLLRGLLVVPSSTSNIITINFRAGDPAFAALVANTFAQIYIDANIELRVDPARQYTRWFSEQGKSYRENLEKAQAAFSNFQQQHGIVAKDEQVDAETLRLNELYTQLNMVQAQTLETQSKQKVGSDTIPDIMQNAQVQALRSEIDRQEARLQEAAGNLGTNHPQYKRMEAEITVLKQKLAEQTRLVTSSLSTSGAIGKNREAELRASIAAQKAKLLEMKSVRDQLAVLQRDVDAAQAAYDGVTKRYNQTNLESQVTQTNVSVLNAAIEPLEPTSPNIPKNIALTAVLALAFGIGAAYLLELIDQRVRSVDNLAEMLQLPVLGVIERPTKPRRFMPLRRRLALGYK